MAYWLVLQGKTFDAESEGEYLWAPLHSVNKHGTGSDRYYWRNLECLEVGDVVFCCVQQQIRAIASVTKRFVHAKKPKGLPGQGWIKEGRLVCAAYEELETPVDTSSRLAALRRLQGENGPLDSRRGYKQGYIFSVPQAFADSLLLLVRHGREHRKHSTRG